MNKELMKLLDEYYYHGSYSDEIEDGEELKAAYNKYYDLLEPLRKQNHALFFEIETAIGEAELEHERRGFRQGYQYALKMLGIL